MPSGVHRSLPRLRWSQPPIRVGRRSLVTEPGVGTTVVSSPRSSLGAGVGVGVLADVAARRWPRRPCAPQSLAGDDRGRGRSAPRASPTPSPRRRRRHRSPASASPPRSSPSSARSPASGLWSSWCRRTRASPAGTWRSPLRGRPRVGAVDRLPADGQPARGDQRRGRCWSSPSPSSRCSACGTGPRRSFVLLRAALGQFALSNLVKLLVERERPDILHLTGFSGSSFPSGHSTAAAAAPGWRAPWCWADWCPLAPVRVVVWAWPRRSPGRSPPAVCSWGCTGSPTCSPGCSSGWLWFAVCSVAFGGRRLRFGAPVRQAEAVAVARRTPTSGPRPCNHAPWLIRLHTVTGAVAGSAKGDGRAEEVVERVSSSSRSSPRWAPASAAPNEDGQPANAPSRYDAAAPTGWMTSAAGDRVHDIAQIGNTVYVAGTFSGIRPTRTGAVTARTNIAAFDATTGRAAHRLRPGAQRRGVRARAVARRHPALPRRRVHDGQRRGPQPARRPGSPTGAVVPGFTPNLGGGYVRSIVLRTAILYAGRHLHLGQRPGPAPARRVRHRRRPAHRWRPGRPRRPVRAGCSPSRCRPTAAGSTSAAVSPRSTGSRRQRLPGRPRPGDRRRSIPSFTAQPGREVFDVLADDRGLVWTAQGGALGRVDVYRAVDGSLLTRHETAGDAESVEQVGDLVYFGGHDIGPSELEHVGVIDPAAPAILDAAAFDEPTTGGDGTWAFHSTGRDLWVGGNVGGPYFGFARYPARPEAPARVELLPVLDPWRYLDTAAAPAGWRTVGFEDCGVAERAGRARVRRRRRGDGPPQRPGVLLLPADLHGDRRRPPHRPAPRPAGRRRRGGVRQRDRGGPHQPPDRDPHGHHVGRRRACRATPRTRSRPSRCRPARWSRARTRSPSRCTRTPRPAATSASTPASARCAPRRCRRPR